MRRIIEQTVVTLDGQISTPQGWLPTRWPGEFGQLSKDLLFSVDALLNGRVSYESHAEVWPTLEEAFGDYAVRMNTIPQARGVAGPSPGRRGGPPCSGPTSSTPYAAWRSSPAATSSRSAAAKAL